MTVHRTTFSPQPGDGTGMRPADVHPRFRPILRRARGGLLIALLTASCILVPTTAQAKTKTDRVVKDPRITESSGLAPSLLHPDVLWTHNDSGNPNQIYAIAPDGSTAATVTVAGEPAVDWEAITSLRGPAGSVAPGKPLIAIADIGDNNWVHPNVRIAIIQEPARLGDTTITPVRVLRLTYPGGPRDAEAVLADPKSGRLYVVSKTLLGSELYAVPKSVWPGNGSSGTIRVTRVTRMARVASMSAGLITDGAFLPDGTMLLRGYGRVSVVEAPSDVRNGRLKTLADSPLPDQDQGESIAVIDGGRYALIGSEGVHEPILRIRVPTVAGSRATPSPSISPTTSAGNVSAATEKLRTLTGHDPGVRLWVGVGGAGLILAVLIGAAVLLRPGRPRRFR